MIFGLRPQAAVKPGHRLDVVVEDIGPLIYDDLQGLLVPCKIRCQHLHPGHRQQAAKRPNGGRELGRAAVVQIVPGHRGDHHIAQSHGPDRLSQAFRLIALHRPGIASCHGAETAMPGADRAQYQEGGCAVGETFPFIGAAGLFADGMEAEAAQKGGDCPGIAVGVDRSGKPAGESYRVGGIISVFRLSVIHGAMGHVHTLFRKRAGMILSCSRYLATVRRAT